MSDYKSAKEAFVSDNPGSSIFTIIAISLVAWTSYAFYATLYPRFRPSFTLDYITSVLPLLLGVTIFANVPISFNIALLTLSFFAYLTTPTVRRNRNRQTSSSSSLRKPNDKSKGSWLEESDSDEEIAEPASTNTSTQNTPIKLPSQVALTSAHSLSPSPSPIIPSLSSSTATSPSSLSVDDPFNQPIPSPADGTGGRGPNKRKLSSQPSPDNITVNILPTPPFQESDSLISPISDYPKRSNSSNNRNTNGNSTIPRNTWLEDEDEKKNKNRKLPFLSVYRAHMMIMTVHCILAVDFKVFPRWLGKCEDFGTSLMDVGVGSFVFSLGIISTKSISINNDNPAKQKRPPNSPGLKIPQPNSTQPNLISDVLKAVKKSSPTLILGFIRLLMVKGVEYPEHVTEYGVHWNFFFTIGLLPIFGILIRPLRKWVKWEVLGIGISIVHQIILSQFNLQSYLLSPSRYPRIIGLNKEGISSLPGYLSIYLIGLSIGEHISKLSEPYTVPPRNLSQGQINESVEDHIRRHYEKRRVELILELFGYALTYWLILGGWVWLGWGGGVSRRFANTPYVLFIASYNTLFLLGYLLLESKLSDNLPIPTLLESINKNGLLVFLVANLGTGLVNVSINSMYANTPLSMLVLGAYSLGVCAVAWALRGRRLKI